jgi:hypothetical protein
MGGAPAKQTPRSADEDDCFCCCSHIIHTDRFTFSVSFLATFVEPEPAAPAPDFVLASPFHPPRA